MDISDLKSWILDLDFGFQILDLGSATCIRNDLKMNHFDSHSYTQGVLWGNLYVET